MSNTHTPGPWETIKRCTGFYDIGIPEKHREAGRQHWIATVWSRDEKHDFNARLIAAAPDMLEALRAIATYMRGDLTTDDFKAFGLKRGDMTGNVRRIAENVLTRIDGEADQAQAERPAAEPTAICCTACGSTSVGCDAYARWDGSEWELSSTFDDTICDACGYESSSGFEEVKQSELRAWREGRGFDADTLEKEDAQ